MMIPIVIKDYEWSQNEDFIFIVVELKGIRTASADIISSPNYLKIHYAPFIFEAFLSGEVDDAESECTIDENSGKVSFRLKKASSGVVWEFLENKELTKEEKSVKRAEAVQITQARHEKEKADREKRRFDRKQATVHDQIRLDGEERERVTKIKTQAGEKALKEFNEWATSSDSSSSCKSLSEIKCASGDSNDVNKPVEQSRSQETSATAISSKEKASERGVPLNKVNIEREKASKQIIFDEPAAAHPVSIRPTVCIPVNFTPRMFPTPSRESTHVEEQEWLKKQVEARKLCGFVDEDLRPEERNPQWLLDKGLSLMRTESYLGAISAFSLGIRLAPKMPELFVERAAAHLAVKNYNRTVADSAQALELLTPKVQGNLEDRLKCHVLRGSAFRQLEMWEEALADYEEAILLQPENNEELTSIRDEIQTALQTSLKKQEEWENRERAKRTANTSASRYTTTPHNTNGDGTSSDED